MKDADLSEREFQTLVIDLARKLGWNLVHFRPGRTGGGRWATQMSGDPGWPDLVLCRPPRLLAAELKTVKGKPTPEQLAWLGRLAECGVETFLWRPPDLQTIAQVLSRPVAGIAPPAADRV